MNITRRKEKKLSSFQGLLLWVYLPLMMFSCLIACFFSYSQRRDNALASMDFGFRQIESEYSATVDDFMQLYLPIFENRESNYNTLFDYFSKRTSAALSPMEKRDLIETLGQMITRDNRVKWIAVYSDNRKINYILYGSEGVLKELPHDFPYGDDIAQKRNQLEVYGAEEYTIDGSNGITYAICGGIPNNMGSGKIIAGYSLAPYESICKNSGEALDSLTYMICSGDRILFNSSDNYDETNCDLLSLSNYEKPGIRSEKGIEVHSVYGHLHTSIISYSYSRLELFLRSNHNTPFILIIAVLLVAISYLANIFVLKKVDEEVDSIRTGLQILGSNDLSYRFEPEFRQAGLNEIANSINDMAYRLDVNVKKAYQYEIKRREAELAELQSKFNPHFLYNTLEVIRARSYQNGDTQTAGLISQLAAIFRGFIGTQTIIPLSDELAFSKRYLSLFGARYQDQVEILYDVDTELLNLGIIRNIFQPLIENYFVHGFCQSDGHENYIRIKGRSLDDKFMLLSVEDNGIGISDETLERLNASLKEPIRMSSESYGLKNLHQRLLLYYGDDCGVTVARNKDNGVSIHMKLKKIPYDAEQSISRSGGL